MQERLENTMSKQLGLTMKLITNLLGICRWNFRSLYSTFLKPPVRTKCNSTWMDQGDWKTNLLSMDRSSPERPAEQSSQNLKKRSFVWRIYALTWTYLTVEKRRQDHCFCNVALLFVSEQLKEDESRLTHTRTLVTRVRVCVNRGSSPFNTITLVIAVATCQRAKILPIRARCSICLEMLWITVSYEKNRLNLIRLHKRKLPWK